MLDLRITQSSTTYAKLHTFIGIKPVVLITLSFFVMYNQKIYFQIGGKIAEQFMISTKEKKRYRVFE